MENIKDYMLHTEVEELVRPQKKAVRKSTVEFSTVVVSGPDFVLRRKTPKTSTLLVIMLSQQQYYIKYESAGGTIETLTLEGLKKFFDGLETDRTFDIVGPEGDVPFWVNAIYKNSKWLEEFYRKIHEEMFVQYAKNNMILLPSDMSINDNCYKTYAGLAGDFYTIKAVFDTAREIVPVETVKASLYRKDTGKVVSLFSRLFETRSWGDERGTCTSEITSLWGLDGLRQIVRMYFQTPVTEFISRDGLQDIIYRKKYSKYGSYNGSKTQTKFDLQSFIDYMLCECTAQGFADSASTFWSCWADYLDAQEEYYGKIVDKYSENLLSDERRLGYKVTERQKETENMEFTAVVEQYADFAYKGSKYSIIVPKTQKDMIEEGQMQSNCVGGYVSKVANRRCMIFFMRFNETPDKSLVTVEIRANGSLGQVLGKFNRQPTAEQIVFINEWYEKVAYPKYCSLAALEEEFD